MAGTIKPHVTSRKTGGRTIDSRDLLQEYAEKNLSRRKLLLGALAAAAATVACSDGAAPAVAATDAGPGDAGPGDVPEADVPPVRTAHLVGAGEDADHIRAAELALMETAGFDFVRSGQRVYL